MSILTRQKVNLEKWPNLPKNALEKRLEKWGKETIFALEKRLEKDNTMITRKLDAFLDDFYQTSNKALLLTGARQVGKTVAFRRFAERHYSHYIEINFLKTPAAVSIFDNVKSAHEILTRVSAFTDVPMVPGETFILFDEIQDCPECVTQIKFLVDEGSFRYGLTGSLLGVELKDIRSEPVGYMDIADVFPLDFEEFCSAIGVAPRIVDHLRSAFENRITVDPVVHNQMMGVVNLYLVVGGMPSAVQKYIDTHNMQHVGAEQRAILNLYKRDISRYDPEEKLLLNEIFELIPSELNAKNKRFILKSLNEGAKFKQYADSFLWLKNAGVAIPVFNVEEPVFPLKLSKQRNLLKLFQNDVGLLAYQYAGGIQLRILSGEINLNYGAVYENFVAQELYAHGYKDKLYYFNSKKQGEVDFVLESMEGTILPTEVKSGKDYEFHLALNNILGNEQYGIPEAITLCNDNISIRGKVVYLPVYMTMFLKRKQEVPAGEFVPDISALT